MNWALLIRGITMRAMMRVAVRPLVTVPIAATINPVAPIEIHDLTATLPKHPTKEYPLRPNGADDIDGVIVHHSAGPKSQTHEMIARYHIAKNWAGAAYHFSIDDAGGVWKYNAPERWTSHAGGYNLHNVGIMLIGNYQTDTTTAAQRQALEWLLEKLDKDYGIVHVWPHGWTRPTACPGSNVLTLPLWRGTKPGVGVSV